MLVMATSRPNRRKVLIVEDHALVAQLTAELIEEIDCEVVGPAHSVRDALRLNGEHRPDVALVDFSLPDGDAEDLVRALRDSGVTCAILTGHRRPSSPPPGLADVPWLEKPLFPEMLRDLMREIDPAA